MRLPGLEDLLRSLSAKRNSLERGFYIWVSRKFLPFGGVDGSDRAIEVAHDEDTTQHGLDFRWLRNPRART